MKYILHEIFRAAVINAYKNKDITASTEDKKILKEIIASSYGSFDELFNDMQIIRVSVASDQSWILSTSIIAVDNIYMLDFYPVASNKKIKLEINAVDA